MPRRVLICTIGSTPQVVTETVWALQTERQWVPDEIEIITTTFALDRIHNALQTPDGPLAGLMGRVPPLSIHLPRAGGGSDVTPPGSPAPVTSARSLGDVNDHRQATEMGQLITQRIAHAALDDDTQLHVSIAGGRKTMSAHALTALSLCGRPRDEASHVLVNLDFEDNPAFFYPTQPGGPIPRKRNAEPGPHLDPATARVVLVPAPVILARYRVRDLGLLLDHGFEQMVEEANLATAFESEPSLILLTEENKVVLNGKSMRLRPQLFALFHLMAEARRSGWGQDLGAGGHGGLTYAAIGRDVDATGVPIGHRYKEMLIAAVRATGLDPENDSGVKNLGTMLGRSNPGASLAPDLGPNRSHLKDELARAFGSPVVEALFPNRQRRPFGLVVPTQAISIV
jgi:CRISPR-associated protein (TIGR02584 family)